MNYTKYMILKEENKNNFEDEENNKKIKNTNFEMNSNSEENNTKNYRSKKYKIEENKFNNFEIEEKNSYLEKSSILSMEENITQGGIFDLKSFENIEDNIYCSDFILFLSLILKNEKNHFNIFFSKEDFENSNIKEKLIIMRSFLLDNFKREDFLILLKKINFNNENFSFWIIIPVLFFLENQKNDEINVFSFFKINLQNFLSKILPFLFHLSKSLIFPNLKYKLKIFAEEFCYNEIIINGKEHEISLLLIILFKIIGFKKIDEEYKEMFLETWKEYKKTNFGEFWNFLKKIDDNKIGNIFLDLFFMIIEMIFCYEINSFFEFFNCLINFNSFFSGLRNFDFFGFYYEEIFKYVLFLDNFDKIKIILFFFIDYLNDNLDSNFKIFDFESKIFKDKFNFEYWIFLKDNLEGINQIKNNFEVLKNLDLNFDFSFTKINMYSFLEIENIIKKNRVS